MIRLSVIVLSYNTKEMTRKCLETLNNSLVSSRLESEIIAVDNASSDGSAGMLDTFKKNVNPPVKMIIIKNKHNEGFPKGNNQGIATANGQYVLFLNSDVTVDDVDFSSLCNYMDENPDVGALTVRVMLPNGKIDPASHRGFPTLWNAFTYFSRLEALLGRSALGKIFGGYHLTHLDQGTLHEIDSPTGAFYLMSKEMLQKVGGFDEQFFMYGEDLDLSYRIKQAGYKIIFLPRYKVTHYKHMSGIGSDNKIVKIKVKSTFFDAMKIFFRKHYEKKYPPWLTKAVYFIIDLKKNMKK